jgi:2-hydroxychromene-2-carboxylate isomerase
MSKVQDLPVDGFTPRERDFIRNALNRFFSTLPSVAEGIQLRRWRGGPQAGQPKLPAIVQGLIARGLMRLDAEQRLPKLFFTEAGMTALRAMMMDRRFADPETFAHVRRELGIDPARSR